MKKSTVVFIFTILILLLITSLNAGYIFNKIEIVHGPYLQQPSETTMTIMWMTNQKSDGIIEYGKKGSLDKKAVNIASYHNQLLEGMHQLLAIMGLKSINDINQTNLIYKDQKVKTFMHIDDYFKDSLIE